MSKYTDALNKIEQEKSAKVICPDLDESQEKPSLHWSLKFTFSILLIGGLVAGAYFLGRYPLVRSGTQKILPRASSFFTIQLVTYQTESRAKKQAEKLAAEGYETFFVSKDGYFRLCLGKFAKENLAHEEWLKLKNTLPDYKDMYVRFMHE